MHLSAKGYGGYEQSGDASGYGQGQSGYGSSYGQAQSGISCFCLHCSFLLKVQLHKCNFFHFYVAGVSSQTSPSGYGPGYGNESRGQQQRNYGQFSDSSSR